MSPTWPVGVQAPKVKPRLYPATPEVTRPPRAPPKTLTGLFIAAVDHQFAPASSPYSSFEPPIRALQDPLRPHLRRGRRLRPPVEQPLQPRLHPPGVATQVPHRDVHPVHHDHRPAAEPRGRLPRPWPQLRHRAHPQSPLRPRVRPAPRRGLPHRTADHRLLCSVPACRPRTRIDWSGLCRTVRLLPVRDRVATGGGDGGRCSRTC